MNDVAIEFSPRSRPQGCLEMVEGWLSNIFQKPIMISASQKSWTIDGVISNGEKVSGRRSTCFLDDLANGYLVIVVVSLGWCWLHLHLNLIMALLRRCPTVLRVGLCLAVCIKVEKVLWARCFSRRGPRIAESRTYFSRIFYSFVVWSVIFSLSFFLSGVFRAFSVGMWARWARGKGNLGQLIFLYITQEWG